MPESVQFVPPRSRMEADLRRASEQDAAEDAADQRMFEAVTRARTEKEDRERRDRIEAAVDPMAMLQAEPPDAEVLQIDITGLAPMRARLVRYVAWIDDLERQLKLLEDGRAVYLTSVGAVAVTEQTLSDLVESDTSKFLAWLRSGSNTITKPQMRSFERETLEKALPERRHEREIALKALSTAEFEADVLTRKLSILQSRHESFVHAALVEYADVTLGPLYRERMTALASTLADLFGLATIAKRGNISSSGERLYRGSDLHTVIVMPWFGLTSVAGGSHRPPEVEVTEDAVTEAAKPWKMLAKLWTDDPRADPHSPPASPAEA